MEKMVMIPKAMLERIDKTLQAIYKQKIEWINREEACRLLEWSSATLTNRICDKTITEDMYTIGVNGKQFFNKAKLLGLA